jgi:hypothetical protein
MSLVSSLFARVDRDAFTCKTHQEEGCLLTRQHLVDKEKSRQRQKITDLCYCGQISTANDLQTAVAKCYTFSSWAFPDFVTDPSALWTALEEFIILLNTPTGRAWTSQHKALPHVFLHLFIMAQHMLGPFIALSNCLACRDAVTSSAPVSVAAYKEASAFAMHRLQRGQCFCYAASHQG